MTAPSLGEIAAVYRDAVARDRRPLKEVADHFEVSQSTATRWVSRARQAGFMDGVRGLGTNPQMRALADELGIDIETFRSACLNHIKNGEIRFRP